MVLRRLRWLWLEPFPPHLSQVVPATVGITLLPTFLHVPRALLPTPSGNLQLQNLFLLFFKFSYLLLVCCFGLCVAYANFFVASRVGFCIAYVVNLCDGCIGSFK